MWARVFQVRLYFNSRPHEEVDTILPPALLERLEISTHDLTRRSTLCSKFTVCLATISTHDLTRRSTRNRKFAFKRSIFQLTTSRGGRPQFLRKKFSFLNHFLCLLHIIYSYYINTIFFSTLFFAKS